MLKATAPLVGYGPQGWFQSAQEHPGCSLEIADFCNTIGTSATRELGESESGSGFLTYVLRPGATSQFDPTQTYPPGKGGDRQRRKRERVGSRDVWHTPPVPEMIECPPIERSYIPAAGRYEGDK
jgi:hypothetical protein